MAGWKEHKKWCRGKEGQGQQLSLEDIRRRVVQAGVSEDWEAVLRWDSRTDELVAGQDQETIVDVLEAFACAYYTREKFNQAGVMNVRCAEACGALKRFSRQAEVLCRAGDSFISGGDWSKAALWYENARDVSKEHGFVSMEFEMCLQLGCAFSQTGRTSEGVEQHRRAWAVAQSVEDGTSQGGASLERTALRFLVDSLCLDGQLEEADTLFTRLREGGDNTADCQLWNHYLRGVLQYNVRDLSAAAKAFQAALDVARQHPSVLADPHAARALRTAKSTLNICGDQAGGAPSLAAVSDMVQTAVKARDWPGVLRWESRLEELLTLNETRHPHLFWVFAAANQTQGLFVEAASLFQRRVQVLEKLERSSEQGADMCQVGDCFLRLNDAEQAEMWYQKARKLGEKYGCYAVECAACLGLGRVELCMHKPMQGAEDLLRHALTVLDFIEGGEGETLERGIKTDLSKVLLQTGRYEEAGQLIQRLRELAERAGADPLERVEALELAVKLQVRRGDIVQAAKELLVLPSDPISHSPSDSQNRYPNSHPHYQPQPAVADETLVVCPFPGATRVDQLGRLGLTAHGFWIDCVRALAVVSCAGAKERRH